MHSNPKLNTPGLKVRHNKDGTSRLYWCARTDIRKKGYEPETVRLHYDLDNPADHPLIEAACLRLQAEMLEWASGRRGDKPTFDGTIAGLVRAYETDPASPRQQVKHNTANTYNQVLRTIERAFGKRALANLGIADFRRWYDEAKKPKTPCGAERLNKAHKILALIRRMMSYGVMAGLPECPRLKAILDEARFKQPGRRRVQLGRQHVMDFIATAKQTNRLSLAIATACQFETGMRQRDVIGEWEPIADGDALTGIVLARRRWVNGLTWTDLGNELVIRKATTKTGAIVSHDLKVCPLTLELLNAVPPERRIGPLIIDETAGRPYADKSFGREWRVIANAAGIPGHVWNMDARAGAITEAEDAGADLDEIRSAVGHTQASTTARYLRGALGKSRAVAAKRIAHRTVQEQD